MGFYRGLEGRCDGCERCERREEIEAMTGPMLVGDKARQGSLG